MQLTSLCIDEEKDLTNRFSQSLKLLHYTVYCILWSSRIREGRGEEGKERGEVGEERRDEEGGERRRKKGWRETVLGSYFLTSKIWQVSCLTEIFSHKMRTQMY